MATTPEFGFRYPDGSDNVDIPTGIQELAFDVEDTLSSDYLTKAGGSLTGALTVPYGIDGGIHIGGSGPRDMAGTGSPEGVVTAPVGSTWRDTNATTGAIKWIKASGSGNTGWKVEYGDTGLRNVDSPTLGTPINGWAATTMRLRRTGNTVEYYGLFQNAGGTTVTAADTGAVLPSGFRPAYMVDRPIMGPNSSVTREGIVLTSGGIQIWGYSSNASFAFSMTFLTADAWPSTLPGTAA